MRPRTMRTARDEGERRVDRKKLALSQEFVSTDFTLDDTPKDTPTVHRAVTLL